MVVAVFQTSYVWKESLHIPIFCLNFASNSILLAMKLQMLKKPSVPQMNFNQSGES